jgi:hypothetical protein
MTDVELPEYWHRFWQLYADSFVAPLKSSELLKRFVTNPNVMGLYAEAWIRSLTRSMLPQFRISTGAVIRASDLQHNLQEVSQCDLIVWNPSELPAIFEQGDFALVPTHSVHAIIEIKRSCSDIDSLTKQLQDRRKLLQVKCRQNLLGVVLEHSNSLFTGETAPNWLSDGRWIQEYPLVALLSNKMTPYENDIMALIYFLAQVAGHNELAA